jgi:hypothetical protein
MASSLTLAVPLESMPAPDSFGGSYDDPAFAGGAPVLAGIDASHQYGTFIGPTLAATLATGDYQSQAGLRSLVTGVRPIVDSAVATVAIGERNQRPAIMWRGTIPLPRTTTVCHRSASMAAIYATAWRCQPVIRGSGQ